MHYFPQPYKISFSPGWNLAYVVTSYTTPFRLSHAESAVL